MKKNYKKLIFLVICLSLATVAVVEINLQINKISSAFTEGANEILRTVNSPDGEYKAVLFLRDLGATARESYQLSILPADRELLDKDSGNVFISYGEFSFKWTDNLLLTVTPTSEDDVFKKEKSIYNIKITYEQ